MLITDTKLDESHSRRRIHPENKDELAEMQRSMPANLAATHVWDYAWEETATAANPRSLPDVIFGPRERTLAEIAEATDTFKTLKPAELRWVVDRYNIKTPDFDATKGPQDEETMLREAIQTHFKAKPKSDQQPRPNAVQKSTGKGMAYILPDDIAKANEAELKKIAAIVHAYDEYLGLSGQSLAFRKEWLAAIFERPQESAERSARPELPAAARPGDGPAMVGIGQRLSEPAGHEDGGALSGSVRSGRHQFHRLSEGQRRGG